MTKLKHVEVRGYQDRRAGISEGDCPYVRSNHRTNWHRGWSRADAKLSNAPFNLTKEWVAERVSVVRSGCWEWKLSKTGSGYGTCTIKKKQFFMHRSAWELFNGPIPEGLWVLHKCDNPPCCNPDHLFIGTATDNVQDMLAKQRRGLVPTTCQKRLAKLTAKQVVQIRTLYGSGEVTQDWIAKHFDVTPMTVSRIWTRRTWRNMP